MTTALQETTKPDPSVIEYQPFGAADKIKLSVRIVQELIAVPTKSKQTCSRRDALKFIALCQAKRLNPFESDCFLIGYDSQDGPSFSLITAHQAFLKRAEVHPEYDGMESGVILVNDDGSVLEREGDFHLPKEKVVGGWARVHFKNRKVPIYRRVRADRFNTGFAEWKKDPAGMCVKCAEADALRSAFPTMLGGLYLKDEVSLLNGTLESVPLPVDDGDLGPQKPSSPGPQSASPTLQSAASQAPAQESIQAQLQKLTEDAGFTFEDYRHWAEGSGNDADASSRAGWAEIPADICKRLLRAKVGYLEGLKKAKT